MGKVTRERALMLGLGKFFEGVSERKQLEETVAQRAVEEAKKEKKEEEQKKLKEFDRLRQLEKDKLNLRAMELGTGYEDERGRIIQLSRPLKTTEEQKRLGDLRKKYLPSKEVTTPEQRGYETEDEFLDKVIGKEEKERLLKKDKEQTDTLPPLPFESAPVAGAGLPPSLTDVSEENVPLQIPATTPSDESETPAKEEGLGFKSVVRGTYLISEEEVRTLGMDEIRRRASGRPIQVVLKDKTIPPSITNNLDALRNLRESMQLANTSLIKDLERRNMGEPSRLITGVFRATNFADLLRKGLTTTENQEFHGYLVRAQSDFLTKSTGAQRGMQEVAFLIPATISSKDNEKTILYKTVQNIIYTGLNMQRARRYLEVQGRQNALTVGDTLFETQQVLDTIEYLDDQGVDTGLLKSKLKEWWADEKFDVRNVDIQQLDTASVRSVFPMLSEEEKVVLKERLRKGR